MSAIIPFKADAILSISSTQYVLYNASSSNATQYPSSVYAVVNSTGTVIEGSINDSRWVSNNGRPSVTYVACYSSLASSYYASLTAPAYPRTFFGFYMDPTLPASLPAFGQSQPYPTINNVSGLWEDKSIWFNQTAPLSFGVVGGLPAHAIIRNQISLKNQTAHVGHLTVSKYT